jgi:hypothetical protein
VLWSVWALAFAPVEVWAAALTLPLTKHPDWSMSLGVLALGLPWSPFTALVASRKLRDAWAREERGWVMGWLQVAGASLVAGTIVPGLSAAARVPALAGIAVSAAAVCHQVWVSGTALPNGPRRSFLFMATCEVLAGSAFLILGGGYLAAAVSYYRPIAIVLVCSALATGLLVLGDATKGNLRGVLRAVVAVAILLKTAHWGVYAPEWNYRFSQGPWGRAIGQFVPPNWPIYTIISWPADLAFSTGRPVRQLAEPQLLKFKSLERTQFVLLHPAEFQHWPKNAPRLILVREFQDERGCSRVLARTEGSLARARAEESD